MCPVLPPSSWQASKIPYNDYSSYIRLKFGRRVQKISVDAGFSCPNRDGTRGSHGCAYCTNASFVPSYCQPNQSIAAQIEAGIQFFSWKYGKQGYQVYFQANSNTYGNAGYLRDVLDQALAHPAVCGLVIGTRPDTLSDEAITVLLECASRTMMTVELGIESTLDRTLGRIGRGHDYAAVVDACQRLSQAGLTIGGHLILGLPGETSADFWQHAGKLNELPLETLKIHHLQILEGTRFADEWRGSPEEFHLFSLEEYLEVAATFLEQLRANLVIERFCNEAPEGLLLAPRWGGVKNYEFTQKLVKKMRNEGRRQAGII